MSKEIHNNRRRILSFFCAAVIGLCAVVGGTAEFTLREVRADEQTSGDSSTISDGQTPGSGENGTTSDDSSTGSDGQTSGSTAGSSAVSNQTNQTKSTATISTTTVNTQISEAEARARISSGYTVSSSAKKKASKRKFLFIGDSYSTICSSRGVTKPWPEMFCRALGISASKQLYARKIGSGFAPASGKSFASLVSKKKSSKKITDIVIMGGIWNDRTSSMTKIRKGAKKLNSLLKKKYPNARIIYAVCNWWDSNAYYQSLESNRYSLYRQMAIDNGWIYLEGLETLLHGHSEYFSADHHHPNAVGSMAIGYAMASAYEKICLSTVKLNKTKVTLKKGSSQKLSVTLSLPAMNSGGVMWKSSKSSVVSVSQDGTIRAKRRGRAVITAKTKYGGRTVKCVVRVK